MNPKPDLRLITEAFAATSGTAGRNHILDTSYADEPLITTFDDVFSPDECTALIDFSHQFQYEVASITLGRDQFETRLDIRNNQRAIYDSPVLADLLFSRLEPLLPQQLHGWRLAGLNERFRFYLYENGQTFRPHYDGNYEVNDWHSSQLTLLIYLNEGFTGGETIFYHDDYAAWICRHPLRKTHTITPSLGQVLIFEHQQLHEGAPVLEGQKYVLRTDVMYKHRFA